MDREEEKMLRTMKLLGTILKQSMPTIAHFSRLVGSTALRARHDVTAELWVATGYQ